MPNNMTDANMEDLAKHIVDLARRRGAAFADVRALHRRSESILVQDGRADKLSAHMDLGVGVRVLVGRCWGFASADSLEKARGEQCLDDALALARASEAFVADPAMIAETAPVVAEDRRQGDAEGSAISVKEKIGRLLQYEHAGRTAGGEAVVNSIVSYSDGVREEVLANTAGTLVRTFSSRAVASCVMVASDGKVLQRGMEHRGIVGGAELLTRTTPEEFGEAAAKKALALLRARPAPAGRFTVVFHPSITGLLVHEALGHNAEADGVWAGQSILEGKMGEMIAAPGVSIYDDSSLPGEFGSYAYDSEGTPSRCRTIVEGGRLVGFLHSLETAAKFNAAPTGNARAESYDCRPIPRMSNTYMGRGTVPVADVIGGVTRGIYLMDGHWGYVFVQKGQFICHAGQARMIENGRLGEMLRDVSISSMTLDVLGKVDAIGDDFEMKMPGMCGKEGQSAPTDCGGPHVRVGDIVVGGHQEE